MSKPYVSIVIIGRNDNYGVNFLQRLNTFIRSLDRQTIAYPDLFELIIVEWNPLPNNPPLQDVISIAKNYQTRIITVPPAVHNSILDADAPVLEFWAKNTGIRRSRGDFVLVTNPDILFSHAMIDYIAKEQLDTNAIYRTDRFDYHGEGIEKIEESNYIKFALQNVFQMHGCPATIAVKPSDSVEKLPRSPETNALFTNASGDFILSARSNFFKSKGLCVENNVTKGHVDSFSLVRLAWVAKLPKQVRLSSPMCIFHMDHPRKTNSIPWRPEIAVEATEWPTWFDSNWGLAQHNLSEWSSRSMLVKIPVSVGELIDKITILEIKKKRFNDQSQLENVVNELTMLSDIKKSILITPEIDRLSYELCKVNEKLWDIEDGKRACESTQKFDHEFIELSRQLYINNDLRGHIKKQINQLSGSTIIEEKKYAEYKVN